MLTLLLQLCLLLDNNATITIEQIEQASQPKIITEFMAMINNDINNANTENTNKTNTTPTTNTTSKQNVNVNKDNNQQTYQNTTLKDAFVHNGVVYQTTGYVSRAETIYDTTARLQAVIDSGQIGITFNTIKLDGKPTLVAGHNPGVFSRLASTIRIGDIIKAYDNAGNEIIYRVHNVFVQTDRNDNGDTTVEETSFINYLTYDIHNREDLAIQFCYGPNIHIVQCVYIG